MKRIVNLSTQDRSKESIGNTFNVDNRNVTTNIWKRTAIHICKDELIIDGVGMSEMVNYNLLSIFMQDNEAMIPEG